MKNKVRICRKQVPGLVAILTVTMIAVAAFVSSSVMAQTKSENKNIKILSSRIDLVDVSPAADKCPKQKGQTLRLKVTSESSIDVRLYVQIGYKRWLPKDFPGKKTGDEITDVRCGDESPNYKIYARAAGSADAWPKP